MVILSLVIFHPCHLSSFSFPWGTPMTQTFNLSLWSHSSSLRPCFFFFFLVYFFYCSDWMISIILYLNSLLLSTVPPLCCWVRLLRLLFWILYFPGLKFPFSYPFYLLFLWQGFLFIHLFEACSYLLLEMFLIMAALKSVLDNSNVIDLIVDYLFSFSLRPSWLLVWWVISDGNEDIFYVMRLWILRTSSVSAGFLWHGEGEGLCLVPHCWPGEEVQVPPLAFVGIQDGGLLFTAG